MPDDPVTLIRSALEAAARLTDPAGRELDARDPATVDALMGFLHDDIEFHEDARFPEAGVYRGVDAVRGYWTGFTENFDRFTFVLEDVVPAGPASALVLLQICARGRASGAIDETAQPGSARSPATGPSRSTPFSIARTPSRSRSAPSCLLCPLLSIRCDSARRVRVADTPAG